MTMRFIQRVELTSNQAAIELTSIPSTFTDLKLVYSLRSNRSDAPLDVLFIRFNGIDSGYSRRQLRGNGSSSTSDTGDTQQFNVYGLNANNSTANTFSNGELYIANYRSSNNKSVSIDDVFENNATEAWQGINAGLWSNSAAVSSIRLTMLFGNSFLSGSSATLYGITAGSSGGVVVS